MTEIVRRSRLFLGSYCILFALLALRFEAPWLIIVCASLALVGLIDTIWIVFVASNRTTTDSITVKAVVDRGAEVSGYLATYLLPFLTVSQPKVTDLIAYAVFLFVLGLIYVRSEMVQINPTLYLLGRRVLHVTTTSGWSGHVIAHSKDVEPGKEMPVGDLNMDVRVEGKPAT